ncbi:PqqD family peptide modification chaperone [Mumia sp. DW29H23]|uniref:PqqD family peptide modification chaperone n=1 Tax=Mumia sp. DW29H23 TaxID=3421241 RepID=UPI003D692FEA
MKLRTEGLTWQEIDGELVILDLAGSVYLTTNAAGAVLTKALVEEQSEESLRALLVDTFGISADVAAVDVAAFLDQLRAKRLLAV